MFYRIYLKKIEATIIFVGEVFAVDKNLIPNSQRDYFNENETRVLFEDLLRVYFYDVLHKLYYEANRLKNDFKRQEEYLTKVSEYQKKENEGGFVSEDEKTKLQFDIDKAKKAADDARKRLDKACGADSDSPLFEIRKTIEAKYKSGIDSLKQKIESQDNSEEEKKTKFVTSTLSKLSRSERKLVGRILGIITEYAPKNIAELIIEKIKEDLR